jgi:serine/threonine protein kinase
VEDWEHEHLSAAPPAVLEDRYTMTQRLGEGAGGEVWVARDKRLEIDVAVKLLHAAHAASPAMLQRFTREADLAERMLSPNVVKVLGRGLTRAGIPFIAYERLEGEELSVRLARVGQLSLLDTRTVIVHLCRGLARAHAVGVLHRDIKPENVFLTTDDRGRLLAKVLDFGVAELVAERQPGDPHKLVGTLEYMAPEVFLDESAPSPQSDLYAVGAVAYACCVGRVPQPAASVGELVVAIATKRKVVPPSELRAELPFELDVWFERALHRDPAERFPSAKAMAEALHVVMVGAVQSEGDLRSATNTVRPGVPFQFEERRSAPYSVIPPRSDPRSE